MKNDKKLPAKRPIMDETLFTKILQIISDGRVGVRGACEAVHISRSTFYKWLEKHDGLMTLVEKARERQAFTRLDEIDKEFEILEQKVKTATTENVPLVRARIDYLRVRLTHEQFVLASFAPNTFNAKRVTVEANINVNQADKRLAAWEMHKARMQQTVVDAEYRDAAPATNPPAALPSPKAT